MSYELYDKTAIVWDDDAKAAAFITPADSALRNFANHLVKTGQDVAGEIAGPQTERETEGERQPGQSPSDTGNDRQHDAGAGRQEFGDDSARDSVAGRPPGAPGAEARGTGRFDAPAEQLAGAGDPGAQPGGLWHRACAAGQSPGAICVSPRPWLRRQLSGQLR